MSRFYSILWALLVSASIMNASIANARHLENSKLQWETSSVLSPGYFMENGYNCFAANLRIEKYTNVQQCETKNILESERLWVLEHPSENQFTVVRCKLSSNCNATHVEILNEISSILSLK